MSSPALISFYRQSSQLTDLRHSSLSACASSSDSLRRSSSCCIALDLRRFSSGFSTSCQQLCWIGLPLTKSRSILLATSISDLTATNTRTLSNYIRILIGSYGLRLHVTVPTHRQGGRLDVVITREDSGCPEGVAVEDVGISDHFLLRWEVSAIREEPAVFSVRSRPWGNLNINSFRSALSSSRLCLPLNWPTDIDEMAALYDTELKRILDQLLPERQYVR